MKRLFKAIVAFFKRLFGPPTFAVGEGEVSVNPIKDDPWNPLDLYKIVDAQIKSWDVEYEFWMEGAVYFIAFPNRIYGTVHSHTNPFECWKEAWPSLKQIIMYRHACGIEKEFDTAQAMILQGLDEKLPK